MPAQTVIKLRRDTSANWTSVDPILASGELGIETDTNRIKIGDGATEWTGLNYGPVSDNLHIRVKNASSSVAIPAGHLVQFAGAAGDTVTASPAVTDGSVDFHSLIGVTASEIAADGFGDVVVTGVVGGINTSAYTVGTLLYADDANPGQLTDTAPTAPSFGEPVAAVTRSGAGTSGLLLVRLHLGASLSDIHDVNLTSLTNGQVLSYDSATQTWVNSTIDLTGYATETYVNTAVSNLVDSAPTTLDTLNELAAALGDDANYATSVTNALAGKASTSHTHAISDVTNLQTEIDGKLSSSANYTAEATYGSFGFGGFNPLPTETTLGVLNAYGGFVPGGSISIGDEFRIITSLYRSNEIDNVVFIYQGTDGTGAHTCYLKDNADQQAVTDYNNGAQAGDNVDYIVTSSATANITEQNLASLRNVTTALPNITLSTSDPSGGNDGDVWLKYEV